MIKPSQLQIKMKKMAQHKFKQQEYGISVIKLWHNRNRSYGIETQF